MTMTSIIGEKRNVQGVCSSLFCSYLQFTPGFHCYSVRFHCISITIPKLTKEYPSLSRSCAGTATVPVLSLEVLHTKLVIDMIELLYGRVLNLQIKSQVKKKQKQAISDHQHLTAYKSKLPNVTE